MHMKLQELQLIYVSGTGWDPLVWGAGVFQAAAPLLLLHLGVSCTGVFTVKIHSSGQVGCVHSSVCILCCAVLGHFSAV